jgi:hypothetical protein
MTHHPVLKALHQIASAGTGPKRGPRATPPFAAEGHLPLDALAFEVNPVGVLKQPLTAEQAQALHATSTPAPHGQRERTVLDTRVRHTGEISADHMALHWAPAAFAALQTEVAAALGLEHVEARLHSLLVYGPGQFFKPHQDTEKHPGMVASLVLVWPSAHLGGELQIWQADTVQQFASQHLHAQALRWCAFYADCRHEVKPVQEGWRVVLTFDLVLPTQEHAPQAAVHPALAKALRELMLPAGVPRREPWLLLLDHEYTEHGLRWPLLKGEDRPRVAALRAAADALGLVPQLALAEIHQNWTATQQYNGRGRYSVGDPKPDELIEEDMVLDFWVDADGSTHKGQPLRVSLADCASFTESHDAFLVNEEYEGYMGNYGETLDYWYRRAALVLQSATGAEAARFATHPDAALADAVKLARRPDQHAALAQRLRLALPDLARYAQTKGRSALARYAKLAVAVPGALATELCTPFEWQQLLPADAAALAPLSQAHGADWLIALLRTWATNASRRAAWGWSSHGSGLPTNDASARTTGLWPQPLSDFIDAGRSAGLPMSVLDEVVTQALNLHQRADATPGTPAQRKAIWPRRSLALLQLAHALPRLPQPPSVLRQLRTLLQHVAVQSQTYPARDLLPLLQALSAPEVTATPEWQALRNRVRAALLSALQPALPTADDHGLRDIAWTCRCADCTPALHWAESPSPRPLQLSMAEARRNHVQTALQDAAAPLTFATLRQGSPHKLVLTKAPGLHTEWQRLRKAWAADLAALGESARGGRTA